MYKSHPRKLHGFFLLGYKPKPNTTVNSLDACHFGEISTVSGQSHTGFYRSLKHKTSQPPTARKMLHKTNVTRNLQRRERFKLHVTWKRTLNNSALQIGGHFQFTWTQNYSWFWLVCQSSQPWLFWKNASNEKRHFRLRVQNWKEYRTTKEFWSFPRQNYNVNRSAILWYIHFDCNKVRTHWLYKENFCTAKTRVSLVPVLSWILNVAANENEKNQCPDTTSYP